MTRPVMPPRYHHHLKRVARNRQIDTDDILRFGYGSRDVRAARGEWLWRLTVIEELPYYRVGHKLGIDHTSIMSAVRIHSRKSFGTSARAGIDWMRKVADDVLGPGVKAMRWLPPEQIRARLDLLCPVEAA